MELKPRGGGSLAENLQAPIVGHLERAYFGGFICEVLVELPLVVMDRVYSEVIELITLWKYDSCFNIIPNSTWAPYGEFSFVWRVALVR